MLVGVQSVVRDLVTKGKAVRLPALAIRGGGTVQDDREGGNCLMSEGATTFPHKQNGDAPERPAPLKPLSSGQGIIRRCQTEIGFGFIARFSEPDVFLHVTDLLDGNLTVEIGQKMRIDLEPSHQNSAVGV